LRLLFGSSIVANVSGLPGFNKTRPKCAKKTPNNTLNITRAARRQKLAAKRTL
jgi:hypothetical protein